MGDPMEELVRETERLRLYPSPRAPGPARRGAMGERREVCRWSYMDWPESDSDFEGDCGIAWSMTEGGLEENGVKFCPRCGGAIDFVPPVEDREDDDDDR